MFYFESSFDKMLKYFMKKGWKYNIHNVISNSYFKYKNKNIMCVK
jgi:hypothetical protein